MKLLSLVLILSLLTIGCRKDSKNSGGAQKAGGPPAKVDDSQLSATALKKRADLKEYGGKKREYLTYSTFANKFLMYWYKASDKDRKTVQERKFEINKTGRFPTVEISILANLGYTFDSRDHTLDFTNDIRPVGGVFNVTRNDVSGKKTWEGQLEFKNCKLSDSELQLAKKVGFIEVPMTSFQDFPAAEGCVARLVVPSSSIQELEMPFAVLRSMKILSWATGWDDQTVTDPKGVEMFLPPTIVNLNYLYNPNTKSFEYGGMTRSNLDQSWRGGRKDRIVVDSKPFRYENPFHIDDICEAGVMQYGSRVVMCDGELADLGSYSIFFDYSAFNDKLSQ